MMDNTKQNPTKKSTDRCISPSSWENFHGGAVGGCLFYAMPQLDYYRGMLYQSFLFLINFMVPHFDPPYEVYFLDVILNPSLM